MKKIVLMTAAAIASAATAAEFDASVPGDVASLSYWEGLGYTALPGSGDTLKLSASAIASPYSASADMTVTSVNFSVPGSFIDLTQGDGSLRTVTLIAQEKTKAMEFSQGESDYLLRGGKWFLENKGNVFCCNAVGTGLQGNYNITFDGCIVTNATRFYTAYGNGDTTVKFLGGAEIYAVNLYPAYGNFARNSKVYISGGSKVVSIDRMVQGDGFEAGKDGDSEVGDNLIEVSGEGTLLKLGGTSLFGHRVPRNEIKVIEGAELQSGGIKVGSFGAGYDSTILISGAGTKASTGDIQLGVVEQSHGCGFEVASGADWYSTGSLYAGDTSYGNFVKFSAATGSCGSVSVGLKETSSNNVFIAESGAKILVRSGNNFKVGVAGACNVAEITDSTVAFENKGKFIVGEAAASTGNLLRISGPNAKISFTSSVSDYDPFGAGSWNTVIVENGADFGYAGQYRFAVTDYTSNNCFSVRASTFAPRRHALLGYKDCEGTYRNRMELLDGAYAEFLSFSVSACENTLFVSNSTFYADDPNRGMRIGYIAGTTDTGKVTGNTLSVAGENVSVTTTGPLQLDCRSRLHFTIPRNGWASAPVKVKNVDCNSETSITVDCVEFCRYTNGRITLVETETGFDDSIAQVLEVANAAENLPPRTRFYLSEDKLKLMFRSPVFKGGVMVIR